MEQTYYKKIYLSSGEVPEDDEYYHTDANRCRYDHKEGSWYSVHFGFVTPAYWLKENPLPSNKEEDLRRLCDSYFDRSHVYNDRLFEDLSKMFLRSNKEEAVLFAEHSAKFAKPIINIPVVTWSLNNKKSEEGISTSELYDKFKNKI